MFVLRIMLLYLFVIMYFNNYDTCDITFIKHFKVVIYFRITYIYYYIKYLELRYVLC